MAQVTLIDKVGRRGHIKIRHEEDPYPGLEEHVRTRDIVCAWEDKPRVEQDEERTARVME